MTESINSNDIAWRRAFQGPLIASLLQLVAACLVLSGPVSAQTLDGTDPLSSSSLFEQPEFLPVEEAYPLDVSVVDERRLRLEWRAVEGYYLYQHAFRFALDEAGEAVSVEPRFPPARERQDEFFGEVQVYYYDEANIELNAAGPVKDTELSVTSQGCADAGLCYPPRTQRFRIDGDGSVREIDVQARSVAAGGAKVITPSNTGSEGFAPSLLFMMLLAFAGGIILNLMPCVLPVLSLKVLKFACTEATERHRYGWYYSAGVVSSFLLVAGLLLALRGAGQAIGWGFQLQSPGFVIALAYLFVVLGLGLSGLTHIGAGITNAGSSLAAKEGGAGSFFTGVLAVVVASPCTAPFMGSALGYALVQPAPSALLVFAALGAGMAAPMLLLSYSEAARRYLPKPGAWMEQLKQALAFPLYATALWLFWVAGRQLGVDVMTAAMLGALLVALGLWLWQGQLIARLVAASCMAAALGLATWRPVVVPGAGAPHLPAGAVAYSADGLQSLVDAGKPVFVDVTADWCITCLANERTVLSSAAVQEAFRTNSVTYMVADWTDYDADIADFVAAHGRSGIPLYVLYQRGSEPQLLPQLLRKGLVIDALESTRETQVASSTP